MAGVAQVGISGGFDLPGQAGDVVFGASPVGGVGSQSNTSGKRGTVVSDLGVVEPLCARAGLDQHTGCRCRVTPITAILAWMGANIACDAGRGGCRHNVDDAIVIACTLAGVGKSGSREVGKSGSREARKHGRRRQ